VLIVDCRNPSQITERHKFYIAVLERTTNNEKMSAFDLRLYTPGFRKTKAHFWIAQWNTGRIW